MPVSTPEPIPRDVFGSCDPRKVGCEDPLSEASTRSCGGLQAESCLDYIIFALLPMWVVL